MFFLKSKQLLIKAAKLSQKKEEKISKREIRKKIHQIKYLTSRKKIPKNTLRKEITRLEKQLQSVFLLEKKLKEKEKETNKEIADFKKQIRDMKRNGCISKDITLRKKVEKLSHLIGDLAAKEVIKKEVNFEKSKISITEKTAPVLTLKKIDELQEKILALKNSGKCSPEKIFQLKERLTNLEKRLPVRYLYEPNVTRHKMLFGSNVKKTPELKKDVKEIFLPPPPKKITQKEE